MTCFKPTLRWNDAVVSIEAVELSRIKDVRFCLRRLAARAIARLLPLVDGGANADMQVFCLFDDEPPEVLRSVDMRELDWLRFRTRPFWVTTILSGTRKHSAGKLKLAHVPSFFEALLSESYLPRSISSAKIPPRDHGLQSNAAYVRAC